LADGEFSYSSEWEGGPWRTPQKVLERMLQADSA
jgi:hypothetical protein